MIVYLVGMPGAGKTVVGRELAGKLGVPFVDLDTEIEREAGKPVSEIFADEGEAAFRGMEAAALVKASASDPAWSRAAAASCSNRRTASRCATPGTAVYLDVPIDQLRERVRPGADRPLIREDGDLERLLGGPRPALSRVRRPRGGRQRGTR